jgi:hypothetical protein
VRAWAAKRGCGSGTETGLDRQQPEGTGDGAGPARFHTTHLSISLFLHHSRSCWGHRWRRGERSQLFQPLDVPDEAEHLRHELGSELRRSPDVAVPGRAVVNANVPPLRHE